MVDIHLHSDKGQMAPVMDFLLAIAAVIVVFVARIGLVLDDAARARTAADAAALAGAVEGYGAANTLAEANGGTLASFEFQGSTVTVVVTVGQATAEASAVVAFDWVLPGS